MKCTNCGMELPDSAQFCGGCGTVIAAQSAQPVEAAPQPAVNMAAVAEALPQVEAPVGELPSYSSTTTLEKKKSKLKPLLIAGGSVLAAGVVGTVVFVNCQSAIKRTFMGENKYAASVMDNTVEKFVGVGSSKDMVSTVKSVGDATLRTAVSMQDYSGSEEEMMLYTFVSMIEAYGEKGIATTLGLNVAPSDDIKSLIGDMCDDYLDIDSKVAMDAIDYIGSMYVTVDQKFVDDVYACAVRFGGAGKDLIKATASYNTNGDTYIAIPDATDKVLFIELPELPEIEVDDVPEIDEKELTALMESIDGVIDAAFENADVEISKDELEIGDATYKGTCVESVFDAELMGETLVELAKVIEDNDYIADFVEELTGEEIDLAGLAEEAEYAAESFANSDFQLVIRNFVTSSDKVVGTEISFGNEEAVIKYAMLDSNDFFAVEFDIAEEGGGSSDMNISLVAEKKNSKSGTGVFKVEMPYYGTSFDFDIEYSDLGTATCFDTEYTTGTFKLKIGDALLEAADIGDESFNIGDEEFTAEEVLGNAYIVLKSAKEGNGIRMDIGLENEELGYYGLYCSMGESSEKVPTSYKDTIDLMDMDEDDAIELLTEVLSNVAENLYDTSAIAGVLEELGYGSLDELVDEMGYDDLDELIEDLLYYGF